MREAGFGTPDSDTYLVYFWNGFFSPAAIFLWTMNPFCHSKFESVRRKLVIHKNSIITIYFFLPFHSVKAIFFQI